MFIEPMLIIFPCISMVILGVTVILVGLYAQVFLWRYADEIFNFVAKLALIIWPIITAGFYLAYFMS